MPTIDKAVAPLLTGIVLALLQGLYTGEFNSPELVTALAALASYGLVYFVKYASDKMNKAIAALVFPLVLAVAQFFLTGEINNQEVTLAIEAVLGAIAAYVAKRELHVDANRR